MRINELFETNLKEQADYSPMARDSIKADKIRSLKNLIAIAKEQGRQLRVQELELELKKLQDVEEGYTVTRGFDKERYQERPGLEGPFSTKSGKVVYYDKVEGKYYDPDTDMYIEYDDWRAMNEQGVAEGAPEGMVRFVLDSERAYEAVMARYGDIIQWDNNEYMMVPAKVWPRVEQVAYDADGIGAEDVDGGTDYENPEHYGVTEGFDKLSPQQKAHEYNLDAAQREMDRRSAEGEDMTGARIDKKTYKIIKPKPQGVAEGLEDSPVANAITHRILMQRTDLLSKFGPEKIGQAIDEVADWVGDVEEIGSSDVSAWVKQVEQILGNVA